MTKQSSLNHPMVKSKKPSPVAQPMPPRPDQRVHVVGGPSETSVTPQAMPAEILREAQDDLRAIRSVELPVAEPNFEDPLIKQELKKREVFEKLLSFRKPLFKDVVVDGLTYKFKILNPHESSEVVKIWSTLPEEERLPLREKMLLMSAALVSIDGYKLEDLYSGPEVDDVLKKYSQLNEWPNPLVNQLIREYTDFGAEVKEKYLADFLARQTAESKG